MSASDNARKNFFWTLTRVLWLVASTCFTIGTLKAMDKAFPYNTSATSLIAISLLTCAVTAQFLDLSFWKEGLVALLVAASGVALGFYFTQAVEYGTPLSRIACDYNPLVIGIMPAAFSYVTWKFGEHAPSRTAPPSAPAPPQAGSTSQ